MLKPIIPLLFVSLLGALAACESREAAKTETKVLNTTESGITILAGIDARPRPIAEAHCAQYAKRAVMTDTEPAEELNITNWALAKPRYFVITFSCY